MVHESRLAAWALTALLLCAPGCSQFNSPARAQNPAPPPFEFVGEWGMKGDGPGQLDDPQGIATDSLGNVYVTDAGSRFVHKFSAGGTPLLSFQDDALREPESIAVDSEGIIYVTDPSRSSVFIFFPDDEHEHHRELRLRTKASPENSISLAVDDDGVIYVLDENAAKVFTFSARLRLERSWPPSEASGANRKSAAPSGPLHLGGDNNLYVADPPANRILRFSTDGHFLAAVAPPRAPADPQISDQFAVSRGYIFVMDRNGSMLHIWKPDGTPRLDVNLADKLGPTHRLPPFLAVSPRRELFVLDSTGPRVLRYRINF
jgi:Beta-propeller repeat